MRVIVCEPDKIARIAEIGNDLKDSQEVVGGYIECVDLSDTVTLVCNEEGKLMGLPANRAIRGDNGKIWDIAVGTFFLCEMDDDGDFAGLSDESVDWCMKKFKYPEQFFMFNGKIHAEPYDPGDEEDEEE